MLVRLRVLGGLHAFRDDVPLAWVPAQHISSALLVYLALERDVTREQLARVLWPEEELDAARHALRQALYRLRHAAGNGLIEDTGDVLRLAVPVACDALEFEREVDRGDFAVAMALYGGAFLKDVSLSASREFEAWTDRQRARFSRLHRRACRARIETLVGNGEIPQAIDAARAWATVEPFDDEAQHRLIELLAGSGQRAEALAQYEHYERLLQGEELEPLDETKALVAMLHAGEVGNGAILPAPIPRSFVAQGASAGLPAPPDVEPADTGGRFALAWPTSLRRRWPLLAAATVVLLSVGIAGVWLLRPRPRPSLYPPTREPVVVLPFEVRGPIPGSDDLGVQTADRIMAELEAANIGRVVAFQPDGERTPFTARAIRRIVARTGAKTVVTGSIARRGDVLEAQARVVRGSDLGVVWTLGPEKGPPQEPTAVLDAIGERVLGAVAFYLSPWLGMDAFHPEIRQPATTLEAVRLQNKASELSTGAQTQRAEAIRLHREAFARDTTWLTVPVYVISNYGNLGWWRERDSVLAFVEARRDRLYPGDALELDLRQATLRSPEEYLQASRAWHAAEPRAVFYLMLGALRARRPREALEYYPLFRPRDPADPWTSSWEQIDVIAAQAYHMMGRFEDELTTARTARHGEPRYLGHWEREVSGLAALGRTAEIERLITESHGLEVQGAPVRLLHTAAMELSLHGRPREARAYASRMLDGLAQWPDSSRSLPAVQGGASSAILAAGTMQLDALRILGRHDEVVRIFDELAHRAGRSGLGWRQLGMRSRVLLGDSVGALAMADSAGTQPLGAFGSMGWSVKGAPIYHGAHILALMGRKEAAVAMLREALNHGWRLGADEPLQWYWEPIRDYPPFQELVRIR